MQEEGKTFTPKVKKERPFLTQTDLVMYSGPRILYSFFAEGRASKSSRLSTSLEGSGRTNDACLQSEREAKSRVKEKKPPKAAINLGTDVDAPWGEKIETSRKDNHQNA